ncbi:MAG: glycosyltransferase [Clostridiales bacterium]|nr:glycosyltransferase [Clostridiales bacterium]
MTTIYITYHCFLKKFSEYLHESGEFDISLICDTQSVDKTDLPPFVHFFPVDMKRGVSLSGISAVRNLRKIFKEEKFDIVQYSTPNAAFYSSVASKSAGIPVRLYCQWGIRYMGFEGLRRALFKSIEKATCAKSTFIEAESHGIRNFALSEKLYPAKKSCVVWNGSASGVDLERYDLSLREQWRSEVRKELGIEPDDIVFNYAGRMTADKGINELLSAFFRIAQKNAGAKLLILGLMDNDGTVNEELYNSANSSPQVIMPGSKEDVERYYAASDIFVSPSYREGFGLVIIEAEAMGLPAIASNVPGQIDAIIPDETGLLFEVKSVESLTNTMERLLKDSELRKKMGKAAQGYARQSYGQKELFEKLKAHRTELLKCLKILK